MQDDKGNPADTTLRLEKATCLAHLTVQPELILKIKEAQLANSTLDTLRKDTEHGLNLEF